MVNTGFAQRFKGKIQVVYASLFEMGKGAGQFKSSGNLYANASSTGLGNGNDTTEDVLDTYSLPANSLVAVGGTIQVYAFGSFGGNTHNKTARLYFGSEVVSLTTTTSSPNWVMQIDIVKSGSSTQVLSTQSILGTTHQGCSTTTGAETDTNAITLKVTGQTSTSASADVVLNGWFITGSNY